MIEKIRAFSTIKKTILLIISSIIWIIIASNFGLDIQTNWLLSTFVIAIIANVFFPMNKNKK